MIESFLNDTLLIGAMAVVSASCLFCNLISKRETDFIYEDDDYVVFKDIVPASTYHYLIVPKEHRAQASFYNCNLDIIKKLHEIGKDVLEAKNVTPNESRFGFHVPPFYSINHLHLHAIAPVADMNCLSRLKYWANSIWFMDINTLFSRREVRSLDD